jgi:MFS family permease
MTVNYLAYAGSQVLLTVMDPTQFKLFSLIAILIALSLVPLALARIETPAPVVRARLGVARLFAISPLGAAGCFGSGLINGAFGSLGPVYARSTGASVAWVAQFMMVAIVSGFALQFVFGRLSDRFDRRTVFLGQLLAVAGISFAIAVLAGQSMAAMMSLLALYGGVAYAIYPISLAHANDFMESNERVAASGGLLMIYGLGSVMGPVAASQTMRLLGAAGLFAFISAVAVSLALFASYRMMRRAPKPLGEQLAFVAVPQTTPTALGLDPRNQPAAAAPPLDAAADEVPAHG